MFPLHPFHALSLHFVPRALVHLLLFHPSIFLSYLNNQLSLQQHHLDVQQHALALAIHHVPIYTSTVYNNNCTSTLSNCFNSFNSFSISFLSSSDKDDVLKSEIAFSYVRMAISTSPSSLCPLARVAYPSHQFGFNSTLFVAN